MDGNYLLGSQTMYNTGCYLQDKLRPVHTLLLGKELTGMKIGMALLLTTVLSLVASAYAQPPSIDGTWHVTAVLTVTSVPNAYVKEGHMASIPAGRQRDSHHAERVSPGAVHTSNLRVPTGGMAL